MPQSEQRSMTTTEWSHFSLTTAPGTLQVMPQTEMREDDDAKTEEGRKVT